MMWYSEEMIYSFIIRFSELQLFDSYFFLLDKLFQNQQLKRYPSFRNRNETESTRLLDYSIVAYNFLHTEVIPAI